MIHFSSASSRSALACAAAALVGACTLPTMSAQAQSMESIDSSSVGAQIVFNNTWGQSFEVTGSGISGGVDGLIYPFATTANDVAPQAVVLPSAQVLPDPIELNPLVLPNSGVATFQVSVTNLSPQGGDLTGRGQILPSSTSDNVVLNQNRTNGVPSITFNSSTGVANSEPSTIAANILGTNIGVESIQVTGTNSFTVMNELSAF